MPSIKPIPQEDQPITVDTVTADRVFIKQIHIKQKDALVPQHSHRYDHTSALVSGEVDLWKDGVPYGSFKAPAMIFIKAGVKHLFRTLTENTVILCIHNGMRADVAAVLEEHEVEF